MNFVAERCQRLKFSDTTVHSIRNENRKTKKRNNRGSWRLLFVCVSIPVTLRSLFGGLTRPRFGWKVALVEMEMEDLLRLANLT